MSSSFDTGRRFPGIAIKCKSRLAISPDATDRLQRPSSEVFVEAEALHSVIRMNAVCKRRQIFRVMMLEVPDRSLLSLP